MATTDWKYASQAKSAAYAGQPGTPIAWTDPGNATTSNNSRATAALSAGSAHPEILWGYNFGFTTADIPAGSTIDSVDWSVEASGSGVSIVRPLFTIGASLAPPPANLGTVASAALSGTETVYDFAGEAFGGTLPGGAELDSNIRDSDFGIGVWFQRLSGSPTVSVDAIRVRVNFTPPPTNGNFFAFF